MEKQTNSLVAIFLSSWFAASVYAEAPDAGRKPLPEPFVKGAIRRHNFGDDRTVRLLGELATGDPDALVRARAIMDLGQVHNPAALPLLKRALSEKDRRVRSAAAMALCNFAPAEAAGPLGEALQKTGDIAGAVRAARRVKWPALAGALAKLIDHPAWGIRAEAVNALTDLHKAADADALQKLLADSHVAVRLAAARNAALVEPDAELAGVLVKLARQDAPAVRGLCLAAVGRLAPEKNMDLLTAGGKDSNPLVRRGAVLGLASAGRGEKIGAFLNDKSTPVLLEAVRAAGRCKRTECIDRLLEIMLQTEPDETHLAARDALLETAAPKTTTAAAGRLLEKISPEYFRLLRRQKSKIPVKERSQLRRRIKKVRRGLKALSYLLGATRSTEAYEAHLDLLVRMDVRDPLLEQLAVSMGQIGDRRAVGPVMKQMIACADFSEKALKAMFLDPLNIILLPEDNSAGLIRAAVMLKVADALGVMMRFSSMGFGSFRAERSAWVADMLMPALADARTRPDVIEELRRQLNWTYAVRGRRPGSAEYQKAKSRKYAVLRCRFESAKSLGKLKARKALEDLRWVLTEDRRDRRVMSAAGWAIQEITGQTPHVGLPKPRPGDWIIKGH